VDNQLDSLTKLSAKDIELFILTLTDLLPASKHRQQVYRSAQASDDACSKLIEYCNSEWPAHKPKGLLSRYWNSAVSYYCVIICSYMALELLYLTR